jgi:hypothetical protein
MCIDLDILLETFTKRPMVKKQSEHLVREHFDPFRNTAMGT